MAIIRKYLAKENYSKMDNNVALIEKELLCDGAYRLYGYLSSFKNSRDINDAYIIMALGIGQKTLTKYKKQLKDLDLIFMDRIGSKQYVMYIGSTFIPASRVRDNWEDLEREQRPMTRKELYDLREKYNK